MADQTLPFALPHPASASDSREDTLVRGDASSPTEVPTDVSEPPGGALPASLAQGPAVAPASDARYAIQRELARGGMGRVLVAVDTRLGREVAIKEMLRAADPRTAARFWRESLMTARLQHPGIVPVYEIGVRATGEPFLTMRRVEGRSLEACIQAASTPDERLRLLPNVLAAADAVAYAHDRRVIHRDLKPANVLVGEFGETVVIDWGLAKELDGAAPTEEVAPASGEQAKALDADVGLTLHGAIIGTPTHMPPEQAAGGKSDIRSDVYALGALLYHLLTGAPPFTGRTSREVLFKVLTSEPVALDALCPWAAPDLVSIVKRAMARDPEARFANARQLAAELRGFLSGQLIGSHRYTVREHVVRWTRKHAASVATGLLALALLASVGVFSVRRILAERELANVERRAATTARDIAEERQQQLALEGIRLLKESDPLAALEAIGALDPARGGWGDARLLAQEILDSGAPAWRVILADAKSKIVGRPGGLWLSDAPERLWSLDAATGRVQREAGSFDALAAALTADEGSTPRLKVAPGVASLLDADGALVRAVRRPGLSKAWLFGDVVITKSGDELLGWPAPPALPVVELHRPRLLGLHVPYTGTFWQAFLADSPSAPSTVVIGDARTQALRTIDAGDVYFSPSADALVWWTEPSQDAHGAPVAAALYVQSPPGAKTRTRQDLSTQSLVAAGDGDAVLLRTDDGRALFTLAAGSDQEAPVRLNAGARLAATARRPAEMIAPYGASVAAYCGPDAFLLLGADNFLYRVQASTGAARALLPWPAAGSISCDVASGVVALSAEDREPVTFALEDPRTLSPLYPGAALRGTASAGPRHALAVLLEDGSLRLRPATGGWETFALGGQRLTSGQFSPDGRRYCFTDGNGELRLAVADGGKTRTLGTTDRSSADKKEWKEFAGCGFVNGGQQLVAGRSDGAVFTFTDDLPFEPHALASRVRALLHEEVLPPDMSADGVARRDLLEAYRLVDLGQMAKARRIVDAALKSSPSADVRGLLHRERGRIAETEGDVDRELSEFRLYLPTATVADRAYIEAIIRMNEEIQRQDQAGRPAPALPGR